MNQSLGNIFDIIKTTRANFSKLTETLTEEELNHIPEGFNNNIAWNFGHIIVVEQVLCYTRAGIPGNIDPELAARFGKGSRPEQKIGYELIAHFKEMQIKQIETLETDFYAGLFANRSYDPLVTSFGIEIRTTEDSIRYLATHDALHYGYAMALKRSVSVS